MTTSYLFLAPGFEEIEALATVDLLRRSGMEVTTVSIATGHDVTGANGITAVADKLFADCDFADADWLICPGGMPGATNLYNFEPLRRLLVEHYERGSHVAAICAAPGVVLAPLGLLRGHEATCYPGFEGACIEGGAQMVDKRSVASGRIVTGNGPGSAFAFALTIIAETLGTDAAQAVGQGTMYLRD